MTVPTSALQEIAPGAVIELFELQLDTAQHGTNDLYRFHAGTNLADNGGVIWNGQTYTRFPIEADGFEYSGSGLLPRPKIRCSNVLSTISAIISTLPNGLEGAKVTRIRTLARYIDAANFPGGVNPYGTPDPTAEFPREIYYIDRKTTENKNYVEYELAASFDLAGVKAPKRQCISNICQWVYKSAECSYVPVYSRNLYSHYQEFGIFEGRYFNSTGSFDPAYYLAAYPDVAAAGYTTSTAYLHWIDYGISEGRNGNAGGAFDRSTYLAFNPDLSILIYFDENDNPVSSSSADVCGKRLDSCKARFGENRSLPYGSFPGIGTYFT